MKTITKRQFMRKPSVISRPKERAITAEEMEAELQKLAKGCPEIDALEVLHDLRRD